MNNLPPANDAASLSRLHDIVSPAPVSWWPLAAGWYVVATAALVLLLWWSWNFWIRWKRNAYRREGLRLLKALPADSSSLPQLDEILKRVALSAFPRQQVAALSGLAWLEFLDRTANCQDFIEGPGRVLGEATYLPAVPDTNLREVLTVAEHWISHHEVQRLC